MDLFERDGQLYLGTNNKEEFLFVQALINELEKNQKISIDSLFVKHKKSDQGSDDFERWSSNIKDMTLDELLAVPNSKRLDEIDLYAVTLKSTTEACNEID